MNKYEKLYNESQDRDGLRWYDSPIAALAVDIEKAIAKPVKVSGPFGLRAEMVIETANGYLIVTPEFDKGNLKFYCDTGELTNEYPPESLGSWNNIHHVRVPLPDSLEKILNLLRKSIQKGD